MLTVSIAMVGISAIRMRLQSTPACLSSLPPPRSERHASRLRQPYWPGMCLLADAGGGAALCACSSPQRVGDRGVDPDDVCAAAIPTMIPTREFGLGWRTSVELRAGDGGWCGRCVGGAWAGRLKGGRRPGWGGEPHRR